VRRTAVLVAVALLAVALLLAGCGHAAGTARSPILTGTTSQWPVLGTSGPVIGVDLYALDNYPAAVVRADGERTLSYIKNVLNADAVGIVWNFFASSDTSDSVESTSSTLSVSNVAILTRIAEHDHLLVEYRPVILVPSAANNWSGKILPADQHRWFDSYYHAELPYLRTAQGLGVREFVAATEMHYLNASRLWSSFFARVARVYRGVISYASWDYDYFPPLTHLPPLKYLGMDMYWHMQNLPANATVSQVVGAWQTLLNEMPASVLRRTAIDETGIEARAGAYANPPVLNAAGRFSEEVQVNWFTAACKTVHRYHLRGVFFWKVDLTDNPQFPATSMSTFEGRRAAKIISDCARL
jgi:hypothetical protein